MNWMSTVRLRALALLLAIGLFALGVISLTALPAWPVVGVAVACAVMAVNHVASRLDAPVCLVCGSNLATDNAGEHGVACGSCGAVNQRVATRAVPGQAEAAPTEPHA